MESTIFRGGHPRTGDHPEDNVELSSARELKASMVSKVLYPMTVPGRVRFYGIAAQSVTTMETVHRSIALGITLRKSGTFGMAVRVQRADLYRSQQVEAIRTAAKGEVDVAFVGRLTKRQGPPWYQTKNLPLRIGSSIAHFGVSAGTLGCFVKSRVGAQNLILSNNHVLANENQAVVGDNEIQPGPYDGGANPADAVGALVRFVPLQPNAANTVDCAVSSINAGITIDAKTLTGLGTLGGLAPVLVGGGRLAKIGRTTGLTHGRVTAFEIDNVVIGYDIGNLRFDGQVEIEGEGDDPFSAGGDSGSLIVNEEKKGVALLFAGGDHGGVNGKGLTYGNSLSAVLDALQVDLL